MKIKKLYVIELLRRLLYELRILLSNNKYGNCKIFIDRIKFILEIIKNKSILNDAKTQFYKLFDLKERLKINIDIKFYLPLYFRFSLIENANIFVEILNICISSVENFLKKNEIGSALQEIYYNHNVPMLLYGDVDLIEYYLNIECKEFYVCCPVIANKYKYTWDTIKKLYKI